MLYGMRYETVDQDAFIRQELTFSEADRLRRLALEAIQGLISLRHLGVRDEYLDEVRTGHEFCRKFTQGYKLAKETALSSASDLYLWQGFQRIISEAKTKNIDLNEVANKVSKAEHILSLILDKKGRVDEENLRTAQRLLLDTVQILW